jgi:T5SS/PEP-CTERM-associated repeat protein
MSSHRKLRLLGLCASAAALYLFLTPALASDTFWNNPSGGSFNDPANWLGGLVPGPSDNAFFGASAFTSPVSFPGNVSNTHLIINKSNGAFDLLSHEYHLTSVGNDPATAAIQVGVQIGDNASIRLIDGTLGGSAALISWVNGSEDSLSVSTSATLNTNILDVGHFGIGHLNVDSGGILNSAYTTLGGAGALSQATVSLDGSTSRWTNSITLTAGGAGKGIITIDNGASATIGNDAFFASGAGSIGSLTVDGASATAPSTFTIANNFDVADSGTAFVSITNQAFVSARNTVIARNPGSKGTLKISDNFAEFRATNLYIGGDNAGPGGTGLVNIANNGVLTVTGPITVWPTGTLQSYPVSIATTELRLRGGKFSAWSNFNAPISNGGGTIEVPGSNILFLNNSLTSLSGSVLNRIGTGDLYIVGPQNHAPNSSFQAKGGQTFFSSNAGAPATAALPASANLDLIIGPSAARIILLNNNQVLHSLTLSTANPGRQSLDLNSNSAPGAFSSLDIYTPASKSDLYAAIANANRAGAPDPQDGIFDSGLPSHPSSRIGIAKLTDIHGDTFLRIRPARIGDLNLDGVVSISDFIDLSSNFGASGPNVTWQEGDLNYDNAVTISDFLDLAANFGDSYSGQALPISPEDQSLLSAFASAHSSVPEPSTLLLLAATTLLSHRLRTRLASAAPLQVDR